jgi:putative tricarboxylic transport membrane protein
MDKHSFMLFLIGAGSLAVTIGLIRIISAYGAMLVFLVFYLRFVGRHPWRLTATIAIVTPIVSFFFFEIALRIILPKGYAEPLFIPLYDIFL